MLLICSSTGGKNKVRFHKLFGNAQDFRRHLKMQGQPTHPGGGKEAQDWMGEVEGNEKGGGLFA